MPRKKSKLPKTHRYKIGDIVRFRHAGSTRYGKVTELTKESDHATYTVTTSGNDRVYPCLGLDGSKELGYVITDQHNEN